MPTFATYRQTDLLKRTFGNIDCSLNDVTVDGRIFTWVSNVFSPTHSLIHPFPPSYQIPFTSFVRTNSGELYEDQIEIDKERIRSVGISLLGGMSGVAGRYELGIDSIGIINEEHIEPITRGRESSQI